MDVEPTVAPAVPRPPPKRRQRQWVRLADARFWAVVGGMGLAEVLICYIFEMALMTTQTCWVPWDATHGVGDCMVEQGCPRNQDGNATLTGACSVAWESCQQTLTCETHFEGVVWARFSSLGWMLVAVLGMWTGVPVYTACFD